MTDNTDHGAELTSTKRTAALLYIAIGLAVGVYALFGSTGTRTAWILAGLIVATGLFRLLIAPLHGKALNYGQRKGEERRRRETGSHEQPVAQATGEAQGPKGRP